jgi:hypothetical protein
MGSSNLIQIVKRCNYIVPSIPLENRLDTTTVQEQSATPTIIEKFRRKRLIALEA